MSGLQFPKNPVVGQQYDFPPYKYYWDGIKWKTMGIGYNPVNDLRDEIRETVFQNMKRSYAEVGFNLVNGSFQLGAKISGWPDIVWDWQTGKGYQWYLDEAKTVPAGSTPSNIGVDWNDLSKKVLRKEINVVWRNFSCVADVDGKVSLGDKVFVENYHLNGDSGVLFFTVVALS